MSSRTSRIARATVVGLVLAGFLYSRFVPRPERFGLATVIDGPAPADAAAVLIFLHGLNRGFDEGRIVADDLRNAGLPANISIVLIRAPYGYGLFGFSWGNTPEQRSRTRARLRAEIGRLNLRSGESLVVAGFSQGATLALDTAAEEPRINAVASLSPCYSERRGVLPSRDLRFLLAHGTRDTTCPIEESRSLANVLHATGKAVRYVEFDGPHAIPPEVVKALVTFATE